MPELPQHPMPGPEYENEPQQKISPLRVLIALVLFAGVAYGGTVGVRAKLNTAGAVPASTWFAPYVDATLTPTYSFQVPSSNPAAQTVLGFVVSDPASACTPSWGGYYTLDQADQALALQARIAELGQEGARAVVSFGGKANTDLAVGCHDVSSLVTAYESVIDHYNLQAIDLDVEGSALSDTAAALRRARAVRQVQLDAERRHRPLAIWLTLPVEPNGLQAGGLGILDSMLSARVDLAGVNIMTMDFSQAPSGGSMLGEVQSAASATHQQLADAFKRYGVQLTARQIWQRLGVTVMIGQNDVAGERFTVGDAQGLVAFAKRTGLGRVSMWSLNRDQQCGTTFALIGVNSNTCSGTPQTRLQFSRIFTQLKGVLSASEVSALPPAPDTNPADAPFPLWSPNSSYQAGYKVVRDGYIYQAKWYNSGEDPAAQVQSPWQTPWERLGPVLPGDHPAVPATLPAGTYPQWSTSTNYSAGAKVLYAGLGYQAKWANQGAPPSEAVTDPGGSPWSPLYHIPGEPTASRSGKP